MKKYIFLGALLCLYCSIPAWTQNKALIKNVGQVTDQNLQTRSDIDFKVSEQKGLQVFIGPGKLHYQWLTGMMQEDSSMLYNSYRLDVNLLGSNANARIVYGQQQATYERYFLSWVNTDNSDAGKVAHRYESVTYQDIYSNIDWKLYFTPEGHLEYDFIVHPGGRVSDIQLQHLGADSVRIQVDGAMMVYTPKGIIKEQAPYSYDYKTQQKVSSSFVQNKDIITFETAPYQGTLVIDPIIEWATYFGANGPDAANSITVDRLEFVYMAGTTSSGTNIATTGGHQQTFGGGSSLYGADGLITKWTNDGVLIWASYYGGTGIDQISELIVDSNLNLFIGGYTNSNDGITTANAHKTVKNNSSYDVFLVKMDSAGSRIAGTYHGGQSNEGNTTFGMAIDTAGNIIIVGNTSSIDYPLTANAYRTVFEGLEGFLAKFDQDLNLVNNTLVGGNGADYPTGVAADQQNNIYVIGYTRSTTGIALNNAAQATSGGNDDGFVVKYDANYSPVWGTYLGGNAQDRLRCIAIIDTTIFVAGHTQSSNNIATIGSFNATYSALNDGLINLYHINGTRLYGTYINGSFSETINKVSAKDNLFYFIGQTNSADIDTIQPIQAIINGNYDILLGSINTESQIQLLSYYGGSNYEDFGAIKYWDNQLYIACMTNSANLSIGNTVHQLGLGGAEDAYLLKINLCDAPVNNENIQGADSLCPATSSSYTINRLADAASYHWLLPAGWQGQSDSNSINVTTNDQGGTIKVWAVSACGASSDTSTLDIYVYPTVTVNITFQNNILRSSGNYPSYQWLWNDIAIPGATNSTYLPTANGRYSLQIIDGNGCIFLSDTIDISSLSISDAKKERLHFYPNPNDGKFSIRVADAGELSVYDILGRKLHSQSLERGTTNLDLKQLVSGQYILEYHTSSGTHRSKLVKE